MFTNVKIATKNFNIPTKIQFAHIAGAWTFNMSKQKKSIIIPSDEEILKKMLKDVSDMKKLSEHKTIFYKISDRERGCLVDAFERVHKHLLNLKTSI